MAGMAFDPMHEVAERIRRREVSPVEVTREALARCDDAGRRLNAFITYTPEIALEMAAAAEREIMAGRYRGPMHGIPMPLKDLLATAGVRTTGGSRVLGDWVPERDARVVELLRGAGAVFVGKAGMPEFAVHPTSTNPFYGGVRNPWNEALDTGGSSSGTAAAIAAGMSCAGPGSDTGGSIRIPSSACGLVGLKPTWGRVSLRGVLPLCASLDHVGPMARTVRDAALLMQVLAGYDAEDPYSRDAPVDDYTARLEDGVAGLRMAMLVDDGGGDVDAEIGAAVARGVETLVAAGATVEELRLPFLEELRRGPGSMLEEAETGLDYREYLETRPQDLSDDFREFAAAGLRHSGIEVFEARRRANNALHQVERAVARADVVISPTLSRFPPPVGETCLEFVRFTMLWDMNGWPAITVPAGLSASGLPIGLQIVARPWNEALLLRAARAVEQRHALAWPAS